MTATSIAGIRHILAFRLIAGFRAWPPVFRLPVLTGIIFLMVTGPWLGGAGFGDSMTLLITLVMTGAVLAVLVILAKSAEEDLALLDNRDDAGKLAATPRGALIELYAGIGFGLLLTSYVASMFEQSGFIWLNLFSPQFYITTAPGQVINKWLVNICLVISGLLIVHISAFCYRQIRVFTEWAHRAEIDLLHTEDLQVFSLQPLRFLLVTVLFASLNIVAYEILVALYLGEQAITTLVPLVVVMLLAGVPLLGPANIIRKRIALAKQTELRAIRDALRGDRQALEHAQIGGIAHEFKAPDLMMYEVQVKAIWEWPIQGFVQRILLYVLLPPLAWVLAALVEKVVDAYVQ